MRAQRELDQAQSGPALLSFQKLDSERLQGVYFSYDSLATTGGDQAASTSSSSHSEYAGASSNSPSGGRPGSARRSSRQQGSSSAAGSIMAVGAGSIGVRPGSSAARRTKELLLQAGIAGSVMQQQSQMAGPGSPNSGQRNWPPSSGASPSGAGPGSLRQWAAGGGAPGSLLGGPGGVHAAVPKARGLVRGSTDALQFSARPASRGL